MPRNGGLKHGTSRPLGASLYGSRTFVDFSQVVHAVVVKLVALGAEFQSLLLSDGLGRHDLGETLKPGGLQPCVMLASQAKIRRRGMS